MYQDIKTILLFPVVCIVLVIFQSASFADVDNIEPGRLNGEFTIVYKANLVHEMKPKNRHFSQEQIERMRIVMREDLGPQAKGVDTDALVKEKVDQEMRDSLAVSQANYPPVSFTETISGHSGSLLFKTLAEGDTSTIHNGFASNITVFDGNQTFNRYYTDNRLEMHNGFNTQTMQYFPIFCSGCNDLSFINFTKTISDNEYSANVLWPGTSSVLYETAIIKTVLSQGRLHISKIACLGQNQKLLKDLVLSDYVSFNSTWLPKRIEVTSYNARSASPNYHCNYDLVSYVNTAVDSDQFDVKSYLKEGMILQADKHNDTIARDYNPSQSIDTQTEETYLEQKSLKAERAAKSTQNPLIKAFVLLTVIFGFAALITWYRTRMK